MRPGREVAIDQFRGLAILLMLPANYMEHIRVVPPWLKHAPDVGITIIDFIAPFFIFAIGLTFGESVRRRMDKHGPQATIEHVIKRALALIGLGMLFSVGEHSYGFNGGQLWGTLQAIGVAIALTLPTLWLKPFARLAFALTLLSFYQFLLGQGWLEVVLAASHAGIQGSLSWAALLMCATVFADLRTQRGVYLSLAVVLLIAGLGLATVFPVSKHRMSVSFDLIVSASAALTYAVTEGWVARLGPVNALVTWGNNSLVLYVSHLMLLSVFLVPETPWWHVDAGPLLALVQGVAFVAVLHAWAKYLERKGIFVAL